MMQENSWNIQKILLWSVDYLRKKEVENPRLDVELLLSSVLQKDRIYLYTHFDQPLSEEELQNFKALLQRRAKREPLPYILGKKEFFSLEFQVSPAVLIPRPETELIVERGLEFLENCANNSPRILDLATGSGCVLLSLLKNLESARGWGLDVSSEALKRASQNAEALGLSSRVQWVAQDLSQDFWAERLLSEGPFDLITANLPYVSETDWQQLPPEIRDFEPKSALTPGMQGTESFDWLFPELDKIASPEALILLEMGCDQGEILLQRFKNASRPLQLHPDHAGLSRILEIGGRFKA